MRAQSALTLAAVSALILIGASPAFAEVDGDALEGRWAFEAEAFFAFGVTQEIGGELEMTRTGENTYSCHLRVLDHIPEEDVVIRTEQACVATRDGDALVIESVVLSVDPPMYNYVPDNFTLTIVSASRMEGIMHAGGNEEAGEPEPEAVFTRGGALLS